MRGAVTVAAAVAAIVGTVVLVLPMTAPSPDASSTATAARSGSTNVANASPIEIQFNAEPRTVAAGGTTLLTWNVRGASEVSIDGIGHVSNPGRQTVAPPGTSVYRLNATRGEVQRSASVEVVVTSAIRDVNQRPPLVAPRKEEPSAQPVVVTPAFRPREGRVVWTGRLAAGELLRIAEGVASMGELTAPLPGRGVTVQVSPETVKVVSQTARDLVLQNMGSTTEPTIIIRWTDSAK
jgi:hypothetical protein